jgi:hypothetical protein
LSNQESNSASLWVTGKTKSGKTSRLIEEFTEWIRGQDIQHSKHLCQDGIASVVLVFAANNDNRGQLADRLSDAVEGTYPIVCKTPVGFITDEVILFWPLIFEKLNLKARFTLRLRPETEQELATNLWRNEPDWDVLIKANGEYRFVRQTLDLLQLAGASGIAPEAIPTILEQGFSGFTEDNSLYSRMGELLFQWRSWCLNRGLLTYGIIYELYWRYLLLSPQYQKHLSQRHQIIFADDTDDYPAIAKDLFELLLDQNVRGVFTYNPNGQVRLGLNADPDYLQQIAQRCQCVNLEQEKQDWETEEQNHISYIDLAVKLITENTYGINLPDTIQSIQTISRAELLRATAESIIALVKEKSAKPEEITIVAPGLDEIGRYTLIEILSAKGIAVTPVNEQRPLISSPIVRALLTLMALVYPGIGKLVDRDAIAEMLTILSQNFLGGKLIRQIDPVRAGLLADYCYQVDPEFPDLLPIESFPRWDRLGNQGTTAYQRICAWIEDNKKQQQKQCYVTPTIFLSKAISFFINQKENLPYQDNTISALRELVETAQHYWEVDRRLRQIQPSLQTQAVTVASFISLLRRGTITANPRRNNQFAPPERGVSLATIFQYRSLRTAHRWQYWLDAGSPLWEQGGAATLFGAPLFLQEWSGESWTPENQYNLDRERLQRIVRDLLGRVSEKVILCHSDLGVNGTEQMGALFPLVQASRQIAR